MSAELNMLEAAGDQRNRSPFGAYRAQQILSARPESLVLMVYDRVIASCRVKDKKGASAGIATLMDALDFEQGEIALGLFRLYRYAMDRVWEGRFEDVLPLMCPLREAWAAATRGKAGPTHLGAAPAEQQRAVAPAGG